MSRYAVPTGVGLKLSKMLFKPNQWYFLEGTWLALATG
ncbi:hypothetical protein AVDCRST_MAG81-2080 [uncultured Synechococcales cyanobacterium]|uniref:Uncharacterized protein n=1 Tax=uncultured Synechococcales cyanobacterium TaxID=1936017 RepID=A0A6J4VB72_9CYAN|nr:hypothetical protein AVDCRST_MAG81-2080 [uncultured Synechococcales cyanobacterium]